MSALRIVTFAHSQPRLPCRGERSAAPVLIPPTFARLEVSYPPTKQFEAKRRLVKGYDGSVCFDMLLCLTSCQDTQRRERDGGWWEELGEGGSSAVIREKKDMEGERKS